MLPNGSGAAGRNLSGRYCRLDAGSGEQFLGDEEVTQDAKQNRDAGILEENADTWKAVARLTETTQLTILQPATSTGTALNLPLLFDVRPAMAAHPLTHPDDMA